MKKLINQPEDVVREMLEGFAALHPGLALLPGHSVLVRADAEAARRDRVAMISGGGSGHEPAHGGYVGRGMLSAAVAGDVFTSPSPDAVLAAIRAVAGPPGALLIVKNYTGDRLNFGLAAERARLDGLRVEVVVVADDVALADSVDHAGRRGLAGTVLVHKIAGASAEAGATLEQVAAEARAAAESVRTMGVGLSACTVPAAGRPGFELADDEIELGLGIHGEPGVRRVPIEPADAIVDRILEGIIDDLALSEGVEVALLVNDLGGTPLMELAIVARRALAELARRGLRVERAYAGHFLTALEMAGVSLSVLRVDRERLDRLDAPTDAPAWPKSSATPRIPAAPTVIPAGSPTRRAATGSPRTGVGRAIESAILTVIEALSASADNLTRLDQAVGDGDLGTSLARGASAVRGDLPSYPLDDAAGTLEALGETLQRSLGGSSGPFYAVALFRAARRLREDRADDPGRWSAAFREACAGIAELGGAKVGDRTMLDALIPAAEAFDVALRGGQSLSDSLRDAATAAEEGARRTASLLPRKGRSSYLGERALGHVDPGAQAAAIWLRALAEWIGTSTRAR